MFRDLLFGLIIMITGPASADPMASKSYVTQQVAMVYAIATNALAVATNNSGGISGPYVATVNGATGDVSVTLQSLIDSGGVATNSVSLANGDGNNFRAGCTFLESFGIDNIYLGYLAGRNAIGDMNVYAGFNSGFNAVGDVNAYIGHEAGVDSVGKYNIYNGNQAGDHSVGTNNVYAGYVAGRLSTGEASFYGGFDAGWNSSGNYNTFLGYDSGCYAYGEKCLYLSRGGWYSHTTNCTFVGTFSGYNATGTNMVFIDSYATGPGVNYNATNDSIVVDGNTGMLYLGRPNGTVQLRGNVIGAGSEQTLQTVLAAGSTATNAHIAIGSADATQAKVYIHGEGGFYTNKPLLVIDGDSTRTGNMVSIRTNGVEVANIGVNGTYTGTVAGMGNSSLISTFTNSTGSVTAQVWNVGGSVSTNFFSGGKGGVAKTGMTNVWMAGDDGCYKAGTAWPNPRFTVGASGAATNTVTDNLTGLMWGRDFNVGGAAANFSNAVNAVSALNSASYGGYNDWRLPNAREVFSLYSWAYEKPCIPNTAGTGQHTAGNPFFNMQTASFYWAATGRFGNMTTAYYCNFNYPYVLPTTRTTTARVCAVRGGL